MLGVRTIKYKWGGVLLSLFTLFLFTDVSLVMGQSTDTQTTQQAHPIHKLNKNINRTLLGPASGAYGTVIPHPVRNGLVNFTKNLSTPSHVVNDLLQGNVESALANTARFLMNTTFGLAGFLDPARDAGLPSNPNDFGITLHVWGGAEGAYFELPLLGPTTERDAFGLLVDFLINPVRRLTPRLTLTTQQKQRFRLVRYTARTGSVFNTYYELREPLRILYNSPNSFEWLKFYYLETRRTEVHNRTQGADNQTESYFDPYEELNF